VQGIFMPGAEENAPGNGWQDRRRLDFAGVAREKR